MRTSFKKYNIDFHYMFYTVQYYEEKLLTLRGVNPKPLMIKGKMVLPSKKKRFSDEDIEYFVWLDGSKGSKLTQHYNETIDILKQKFSAYFI